MFIYVNLKARCHEIAEARRKHQKQEKQALSTEFLASHIWKVSEKLCKSLKKC